MQRFNFFLARENKDRGIVGWCENCELPIYRGAEKFALYGPFQFGHKCEARPQRLSFDALCDIWHEAHTPSVPGYLGDSYGMANHYKVLLQDVLKHVENLNDELEALREGKYY